jgi:subtilisin family serine protease/subtilisin-like proprotein convertase family protein
MNPKNSDQDNDGVIDGLQSTGKKGDQFFNKQWHIKSLGTKVNDFDPSLTIEGNDYNLMDIYHRYMGYNGGNPIIVQVVDTGVDINHEDLKDNIDLTLSRDSNKLQMGDPREAVNSDGHGTMCAGIIGARAFNGKGVRGVAPFVKIAGSNWMRDTIYTELANVWIKNDPDGKIAIASNSWGAIVASDDKYFENLMKYGSENLRKVDGVAKGKLFIMAAGNSRKINHDCGLEYLTSNPYVITVAALKNDNTYASYSSPGSSILVSGYSGEQFNDSATIGTTYLSGKSSYKENIKNYDKIKHCYTRISTNECTNWTWLEDDDNDHHPRNYTYAMNGTSAATPGVAGILALVLEACPTLTWRDVKYLIAKTSIKVDSSNTSWITNSAGFHHSVDYGFGLINGSEMIKECQSGYKSLSAKSFYLSQYNVGDITIPDSSTNNTLKINFDITTDKIIEWLGVTLYSDHALASDLEIYLTSPSGTRTRLMIGNNSGGVGYKLTTGFRFGSVAFMGESSSGNWKLEIHDIVENNTGKLNKIKFEIMGH